MRGRARPRKGTEEEMEVIVEPIREEEVLRPVDREATAEEIKEAMVAKAQNCVDSLCGCSKGC